MLSILIVITYSIDIGIDIGSFYTKSAIISDKNYPEIALNLQTKRLTPTFISFKNKAKYSLNPISNFNISKLNDFKILIGDDAIENQKTRPYLSSGYFPLFIDLNEKQAYDIKYLFNINSTVLNIGIIDLLSLYFLNYLDSIVPDKNINTITVAVPAYFTVPQRQIIENAFINIGHQRVKIIDDIQAITNIYSVEKQNYFFNQEKQVLFIDIGSFSIKSYVVKFNLARDMTSKTLLPCTTRLSYTIDTNHGGSFVTKDIADYFQKKIFLNTTSKNASNFLNINEKILLFNEAEKAKNHLTLVKNVPIDAVINDQHYSFDFTRDELEEIAKPTMQAAADLISEAAAGLAIDYVEVIGGASRIPLQIDYLKEAALSDLYLNRISKSLNADESIAIGAAYSSRSKSNSDKYPLPSKIIDKFPIYTITANDIEISKYNSTHLKSFNFGPVENINFKYNRKEFPYNFKTDNFSYQILNKDKCNVTAYFQLHPTAIKYVDLCKKGNDSNIKCSSMKAPLNSTFSKPSISIQKIINETNLQKNIIILKGELAQFILKIQDEFENNETVNLMANEGSKNNILKKANEIKIWLENISQINIYNESIMNEIKQKDRKFKELIKPIFENIVLYKLLSNSLTELKKTLDKATYFYYSEWPKNKEYLNDSVLYEFDHLLNITEKLYKNYTNLIRKRTKIEALQILSNEEINKLINQINHQIKVINAIQPSNYYLLKKRLYNPILKIKATFSSIYNKSHKKKKKKIISNNEL